MADILIKSAAELKTALANAKGGETFVLAPGDYGNVEFRKQDFAKTVTIVSQNEAKPAKISTLFVYYSSNIAFKDLEITSTLAQGSTANSNNAIARVSFSKDVSFEGVYIHGTLDGTPANEPYGLVVRDSANISVKDSEFEQLHRGATFGRTDNISVVGNSLHDLRSDGFNFTAVNNVVIDSNHMTDFYPVSPDHPDGIQFWTNGQTEGSSNITITNNQILQGKGTSMQGIFMRDELEKYPYNNVTISNNLIYSSEHYNGIAMLGGASNVTITDNTVITPTGDTGKAAIRLLDITNGTVTGNVVDTMGLKDNTGMTVNGNLLLDQTKGAADKIAGINDKANAVPSSLVVPGIGYQLEGVGSAIDLTIVNGKTNGAIPPTGSDTAGPVVLKNNILLDLQIAKTGITDGSAFGAKLVAAPAASSIVSTTAGSVYKLTGSNGMELTKDSSTQLAALDKFTVSFSLKRDSTTAGAGGIMRVYGGWTLSLTSKGELQFAITNDAGTAYTIKTTTKISDLKTHQIDLTFDSSKGIATIHVDGAVAGSGKVAGTTALADRRGFYLGDPFKTSFLGEIGSISVRNIALTTAEIQKENTAGKLVYGIVDASNGLAQVSDVVDADLTLNDADPAAVVPTAVQVVTTKTRNSLALTTPPTSQGVRSTGLAPISMSLSAFTPDNLGASLPAAAPAANIFEDAGAAALAFTPILGAAEATVAKSSRLGLQRFDLHA